MSQNFLAVTKVPVTTLSYANITFNDPAPTAQIVSESNGVRTFSVAAGSATVCSIDSSTGDVTVLGAGDCHVTMSIAPTLIERSVTINSVAQNISAGGFAATTVSHTFTVAKAPQAPLVANGIAGAVSGGHGFIETITTQVGNSSVTRYRATVEFSKFLPLNFSGGSTAEPIVSPTTAEQCRVIGGRLFAGSVVLNQGVPGVVCEITFSKAGDANYLPVENRLAIRVIPTTQAPLILANANNFSFGQTLRLFTGGGSGEGQVNYQITSGNDKCEISTDSAGVTLRGLVTGEAICTVRATKAASLNFLATQTDNDAVASGFQDQVISVNKALQSITFTSNKPAFAQVGDEYTPSASSTSSLPVTIAIVESIDPDSGDPICEFESGKVVFRLIGECVLEATQPGNDNYLPGTNVRQSILVGGLNQQISFAQPADVNFGDNPFVLSATANSGLAVSFARGPGSDAGSCTVSPTGAVTVGQAGVCEVIASRAGNQVYSAASDVIHKFKVLPVASEPPFITSISVGDKSITLSYREPGNTGGSATRAYQATLVSAGDDPTTIVDTSCLPFMGPISDTQPTVVCQIDGLTNGVTYTLRMAAITDFGVGREGPATEAFSPRANYSAVSSVSAVSSSEDTTLSWVEPQAIEGEFLRYDIYVRAENGEFPDEPTTSVDELGALGTDIALADLPDPYVEEEPQEGEPQFQPSSFRISSGNSDPNAPVSDGPVQGPSVPSDPMSQVPRYDFKIVTISTGLQTEEMLNTTIMSQQLISAPSAPNTVDAQTLETDLLVGWTASKFDGGSRIQDYVVSVNGEELCVRDTPGTCVLEDWAFSTTYEVTVAARNEIGLSTLTTTSITTIDDPTPPVVDYQYPGPLLAKLTPSTAAQGKVVTVTGARLDMVERLLIGGIEAEFVIYSGSKLAFKVPFGLKDGLYSVVVFSEFGELTVQDALRVMGAPVNETLEDKPTDSRPGDEQDTDGDGIPNEVDGDIDGDGTPNGLDSDIDGDNLPNVVDPDPTVPNDEDEALDEPRPTNGERPETDSSGTESDQGLVFPWFNVALGLMVVLMTLSLAGSVVVLRRKRLLKVKQDQA